MIGIGDVLNGKYRLLRLLGDGGMGSVYEAVHEGLGTKVAIKVLHPELARRTGLAERFLQEARVAAQIRSPHVVQVLDVDRVTSLGRPSSPHESHAFIVMELLEGEPLSAILDRQRQLPIPTAIEYTAQILEALEAAHALGVVHRDLKPENVFVTHVAGKTVIKLIDFGIAKLRRTNARNLTVAGVVMGTAEYMAPEQARSADKADARSDLYAVGVMLYEMIAGTRPVLGEDARIVAAKVERGEVRPLVQAVPDVPRELAGLVHRAMAARPELRFASATEMRLALTGSAIGRRTGAHVPFTGPMPAPPYGATALAPPAPSAAVNPAPEPRSATVQAPPPSHSVLSMSGVLPGPGPHGTALRPPPGTPEPYYAVGRDPARHGLGSPPPYVAYPPPVFGAAPPPRGRGRAWMWTALVIVPLALGIGVVVAWVASGSNPFEMSEVPAPPSTPTSTSTPLPWPTGTGTEVSPPATIAPLTPAPEPSPPRASGPATARPPASDQDAPLPPFVLPSGFPSAFPLPDGGLFPLPTTFPTALPSDFPTTLPTWPPPPPPQ